MRSSEFRQAMNDVFGEGYASSVASQQTLSALGGRTPDEALADGVDPVVVWKALCQHMGVPVERRWPADPKARHSDRV